MAIDGCKQILRWSAWHSRKCGRPVKENGLCGKHAAAERTKAKNRAVFAENRKRDEVIELRAKELGEKYGITLRPEYSNETSALRSGYTGRYIITEEDLKKVAKD